MKNHKSIHWFWAHRRNISLHHCSLFLPGLRGRGWAPAVDFWFDNQVFVGVPGKGAYLFYDRKQLSRRGKYKNIQKSIDKNPNFVADFRRKTDEIFGAMFFKAMAIDEANLTLISCEELARLFDELYRAVTIGPIITVQLWGIEACLDDEYRIMRFLRRRLKSEENALEHKELLVTNTGMSVAVSEQIDFYRVADALDTPVIRSLFKKKNLAAISNALQRYPKFDALFERHITTYEWVNTEYVSGGWSREQWIELFKQALLDSERPKVRLRRLHNELKHARQRRLRTIKALNPPKDVQHALSALEELIAQRDWSKGWYAKILLSYNHLLDEVACRMRVDRRTVLLYSCGELGTYLETGKRLPKAELKRREEYGFVLISKQGEQELITGKQRVQCTIFAEKILGPFTPQEPTEEFSGLGASRGKVTARARVIEDVRRLSEFQKGEVIVTYMTSMEFTPVFRKAAAVVTDEGGMSSHAAIISREFGLPCVVGTQKATRVIRTGDRITVDGDTGTIIVHRQ